MTFDLVVPALSFRRQGQLDTDTTASYAATLTSTPATHVLVSGSAAHGNDLSTRDRAKTLDLWLRHTDARRLIACCWSPEDIGGAINRGITPLVVLWACNHQTDVLNMLASLPQGSYVYSHPRYTPATLDGPTMTTARTRSCSPTGAKISKASYEQLRELRQASGPRVILWHGSSRNIAASIASGASGVVSTALAAIPESFAENHTEELQSIIDHIQAMLDQQPNHHARTELLTRLWRRTRR